MEGGCDLIMVVEYPDLSNLGDDSGIAELMALPNSSLPFYWALILVGIWVIISLSMYFKEKADGKPGNLLSGMAVSALAVIMLATLGSLFNIISLTVLLPLIVGGLTVIAFWIFSGSSN